jgi:putative ABC transport system ATP-binding protein
MTEISTNPLNAEECLRMVGLGDRLHHFPAQLSGGEQQRVAIARAVVKRPEVLLCDEPTGALDYATGKLVLEILDRINRELKTITAVITHNAAIAAMADRSLRISSGRIVDVQKNERRASPAELAW